MIKNKLLVFFCWVYGFFPVFGYHFWWVGIWRPGGWTDLHPIRSCFQKTEKPNKSATKTLKPCKTQHYNMFLLILRLLRVSKNQENPYKNIKLNHCKKNMFLAYVCWFYGFSIFGYHFWWVGIWRPGGWPDLHPIRSSFQKPEKPEKLAKHIIMECFTRF